MGKSKELATGAAYVDASGDTMTGTLNATGVVRNTNGLRIGASNASTGYGLRIGASGATDPLEIWRDHANGDQIQLSVDYYGRVTMPYQPAFNAYPSTSLNYTSGTVIYDSTSFNVGSCYNTSTGVFTAPIAGRYIFHWSYWAPTNVASRATFWRNGAIDVTTGGRGRVYGYGDYLSQADFAVCELSANDYVQIVQEQGTVHINYTYNSFSGYLIG